MLLALNPSVRVLGESRKVPSNIGNIGSNLFLTDVLSVITHTGASQRPCLCGAESQAAFGVRLTMLVSSCRLQDLRTVLETPVQSCRPIESQVVGVEQKYWSDRVLLGSEQVGL